MTACDVILQGLNDMFARVGPVEGSDTSGPNTFFTLAPPPVAQLSSTVVFIVGEHGYLVHCPTSPEGLLKMLSSC